MRRGWGWLAMSVFVGVLAGAAARADDDKEEKVPLDKVPRAVLEAVKAKFKDAELVGAEKEGRGDKLVYEINLKHKGHKVEVSVKPDGKIVSIEKTIAVKDLPKAVTEAIDKKYPRAAIKLAEEITEGDKTSYEVLLETAARKSVDVVLSPTGEILKEEKKDGKD